MQKEQIAALFDQQAPSYDQRWSKTAALNGALHLLTCALLADLPADAKVLCVGAGTGAEILALARQFPGWHFTAVEPSTAMLEVFRSRAEEEGIASRCVFHAGFLESLPIGEAAFDVATSFLVSQFITEREVRAEFFRGIARRLRPEGVLVTSDLAAENLYSPMGEGLLKLWCQLTSADGASPETIQRMREAYSRDVAVYPPVEVSEIITRGGFTPPTLFYQAGLIHAWFAKRA